MKKPAKKKAERYVVYYRSDPLFLYKVKGRGYAMTEGDARRLRKRMPCKGAVIARLVPVEDDK